MNKQIRILIIAIGAMASMAGCNRGRSTRIVSATDGHRQEIKYSGSVVFTPDSTGIAHISRKGFLFFDEDGKKLRAESSDKNQVVYSFDGDGFVNQLSAEQKEFLAHAVKAVIRERARLRR
ncbi:MULTISPECIES: hypothetical protein [unclassified Mucilaginibacter]|uniref:hypothetical protein n=1 Tax=unclassified Mucilaginibacter TaxID=2617802 RepID=UPI0009609267|nr:MULTISPECIES: hypothetical protein [unclassified Mucilaginibacter]OJW13383.1 MAG: hypothetical protein BGO48_01095 [Mucilaginibacter sp. 44-25]PLW88539.1 MAG: hypothetical protein C0154_16120 [Mucilaginibacter sp.]HEK20743.1 hypothetical protein [Bacteroidota bacterium]